MSRRKQTPAVSVVIPTYKRAHLIHRAVHSALWQTFSDLEVIVVDDASPDDTAAVVGAIRDPRVRHVRHEANRGLAAARNTGIAHARGEYVAFLDDDDLWLPEKIAKQLAAFGHGAAIGAVHCAFLALQDGLPGQARVPEKIWTLRGDIVQALIALRGWYVLPSTLMVRKDVIATVGGFDESFRRAEDVDFCIRVACRYEFGFVPEVLVLYAQTPDSLMTARDEVWRAHERLVQKHEELFRAHPAIWSDQLYRLGKERSRAGDLEGAEELFHRALAADPRNWKARARWRAARLGRVAHRAQDKVDRIRRAVDARWRSSG